MAATNCVQFFFPFSFFRFRPPFLYRCKVGQPRCPKHNWMTNSETECASGTEFCCEYLAAASLEDGKYNTLRERSSGELSAELLRALLKGQNMQKPTGTCGGPESGMET